VKTIIKLYRYYLSSMCSKRFCTKLQPSNDAIVNWVNRVEVQTCELEGLADLATNSSYVQTIQAAYIANLLSLGVDGLRLDAAKNIAASDLEALFGLITSKPYITSEVIWGAGQPIQPAEFVPIGDVQEFRYTSALQSAFLSAGIASLESTPGSGWVPANSTNCFVADHDTERNGASLAYNSTSNTYVLAHVFMLAHPYGTPTVLSSYEFESYDQGSPNNGTGTCSGNGGTLSWLHH